MYKIHDEYKGDSHIILLENDWGYAIYIDGEREETFSREEMQQIKEDRGKNEKEVLLHYTQMILQEEKPNFTNILNI